MKKGVLFLVLSLVAITSSAQMSLTLEKAIEIALSDNPTLKVAQMEVERFDYVKRQTWGALLPQVNVTGQLNHQFIQQQMSKGLSFGSDGYNTISGVVDAQMNLFAPQVYRTLKLNDAQMLAAVEASRASRVDLIAEVRLAFYNILLSEQSLVVLKESQATAQRTVDDTQVRYDSGIVSEYDLLTAQVQLSNIQPNIIQTENSIKLSKLMLKMYLSIPEAVEIDVVGELNDMRDEVLAGVDNLSIDAVDNTTLRSLELQEDILKRQLKASNASRLPTVGLFGNFTVSGSNSGNLNFESMEITKDGYFWQNPLYAGVRVSIPLFSGFTKTNKSREIKNQISQITMQRTYAEQQVAVQVRSALNDLLAARETMYAQERSVEQATRAYSISNTRYGAGAGTILELNTSQLNQTQAQLNLSQSIYDYLSAMAEYERVMGRE